jgi:hypothetical protein
MPYELEWQRMLALAVAIGIAAVGAGVVAFRPQARVNRRLGAMLGAQAMGLGAGWSLGMMATDPVVATFWITLGWIGFAAFVPFYLLFLATLKTPLVRPLTTRWGTGVLWALAVAVPALVLAQRDWFFYDLIPRPGHATFVQAAGTVGMLFPVVYVLPPAIYGLLAAIHQWWTADEGSLSRQQALAYALAFGWRDASWFVLLAVLPALVGANPIDSDLISTLIYGGSELGFMLLIVYGVLSTQLFDIDVKARFVITQSTFAAFAGGLFFLIGEATERLVSFDGLPALLWAAIIALAFRPLQRLSRRFAARTLPIATPEEEVARRRELYDVAVASFAADGEITARDAAVLERMRERLRLG